MTRRPGGRSTLSGPADSTVRATLAAAAEAFFRRGASRTPGSDDLEGVTLEVRRLAGHVLLALWCHHHVPGASGAETDFTQSAYAAEALEDVWERVADRSELRVPLGVPTWLERGTLGDMVREVFLRADAALRDADAVTVGSVTDILAELRVARADVPHVEVGQPARWVDVTRLLAIPAETRLKWLHAETGLARSALRASSSPLGGARTVGEVVDALARLASRRPRVADRGEVLVTTSADRRRAGAHYTPLDLAERVVERTLAPLLEGADPHRVFALRVCDPAAGSGVFLHAAAEVATRAITSRGDALDDGDAFAEVVGRCLCAVDVNATAAELAALTLGVTALARGARRALAPTVVVGNALVSPPAPTPDVAPVDFARAFPDVFSVANPGFDAMVGNPPWVAYAGRAAQPLDRTLFERFKRDSPAFAGYRTLHGLFVWRAASLLRRGGRLGLVLPTSVADLAGYAPTRRAHDALCEPDPELDDYGDGMFEGVFQPCMALTSTRRANDQPASSSQPWELRRSDLSAVDRALLERLDALPKVPPSLFGERGLQTTAEDAGMLCSEPAPGRTPLREGSDLAEFRRAAPRLFVDAAGLGARLRPPSQYAAVAVLIRQTARFPIAQVSDGLPFRNSILAGFGDAAWSAPALTAYLNSTVIRWFHYMAHRDARQGMPQVKIGHLRRLPQPDEALTRELDALAQTPATRNSGLTTDERRRLDAMVSRAFGLSAPEWASVERWAANNPVPRARRVA